MAAWCLALATLDGLGCRFCVVAAGRWSIVSLLDPAYPLPAAVSDALAGENRHHAVLGWSPACIATQNFLVLKHYNNSDAYAIAVGHLADRLHGGGPFRTAWPKDDRPLSRDLRIALQKKLAALGYKVADFEGRIDFDIRDYIRAEQKKNGMVPDGNPTMALLDKRGVPVR